MSDTKLNAIALYGNFIAMALVGVLVNPLLAQGLGAADFGIWKSCLRLLDIAGVADGRTAQALKWIVAHGSKSDTDKSLQRTVGASIIIWVLWLPLLIAAILGIIYLLPWLINGVAENHLSSARWTAAILGASVVLTALLGIPDAALFGSNQGYRSIVLTTLYLVICNGMMLIVVWAGYGLPALAAVTLGIGILNGFSTWLVARRRIPWWGTAKPTRADITRFAGFSNWTLVWSLVQSLLLSSEILLIGFLAGPVAVTKYTFCSYSIQFALAICLMTGSAITPKLGALIGTRDMQTAGILVIRTREVLLAVMTVSGAGIILLNRTFVSTWISPDYYMGDQLNVLMVVAFLQLALIRFDAQVQDLGLDIAKKVLVGLLATCSGLFLAWLCYAAFGSLESLYIGLIIGRLPASILLPQLVVKLIPDLRYNWRAVIGLGIAVVPATFIAPMINQRGWLNLALTSVVALTGLSFMTAACIISAETRSLIKNGFLFRTRRESF